MSFTEQDSAFMESASAVLADSVLSCATCEQEGMWEVGCYICELPVCNQCINSCCRCRRTFCYEHGMRAGVNNGDLFCKNCATTAWPHLNWEEGWH